MVSKIQAVDLRPGQVISYEGELYRVVSQEHVKTGRGGAHMQLILKNMLNNSKKDTRMNTSVKVDLFSFSTQEYSFSYISGDDVVCFSDDGEEVTFRKKQLDAGIIPLLQDDVDIRLSVQYLDEDVFKITLPKKAEVIVTQTEPSLAGQTVTSTFKPALLKNGWKILVPTFIQESDKIIIDTEELMYVSKVE